MLAQLVPLVVWLNVLLLMWVMVEVGRARVRYRVAPPATSGPVEFEARFRVQMNTIEQTVMFLPSLWLCNSYFRADVAGVVGMVWIIGRVIYALGYYQAPKKRALGFGINSLALLVLFLFGGFGLFRQLFA